jgi:SAM-dependent methyltransferase
VEPRSNRRAHRDALTERCLSDHNQETAAIADFYDQLCGRFGDDLRSVAWGSRASQEKRFAVLAQIADLSAATVLDVGCGLGDFYDYLQRHSFRGRYLGFDLSEKMLELAAHRHPGVAFEHGDIRDATMQPFDYVVASGIFNRRVEDSDALLQTTVQRMYELCEKGVAFNVMSTHADFRNADEYYAAPEDVLRFCQSLNRRVVVRHDYMPHDVTYWIYR